MATVQDSQVGARDLRLLRDIRQYGEGGGLALEDVREYLDQDGEGVKRLLAAKLIVQRDGYLIAVDQLSDPLGDFRKAYLEWLEEQPVWQAMPHKQRGVIATAIKKHMNPEDGLLVGPKTMAKEYRGPVSDRTIDRALSALSTAGAIVGVPRKRPNGSTMTSARFAPPAFYEQVGVPVPGVLAAHVEMPVERNLRLVRVAS